MNYSALLLAAALVLVAGCTAIDAGPAEAVAGPKDITIPTTTPEIEPPLPPGTCETRVWLDHDSTACNTKKFCGPYGYPGLKTFDTLNDCEDALYEKLQGL
ncbi:hypothetical protein ACFLQ2_03115 [archaeon]